jgi:hypothetical protein
MAFVIVTAALVLFVRHRVQVRRRKAATGGLLDVLGMRPPYRGPRFKVGKRW